MLRLEIQKKGNTHADDAVLADELDQLVGDGALCVALAVRLEVTQVTDVADLVLGGAVVLAVGVDWHVSGCLGATSARFRGHAVGRRVDGLQWGPAEVQPLVLSPKAWTCMPRSALASLPVMFHETVVGELSFSCSKVTVPLTLESPRRTATMRLC